MVQAISKRSAGAENGTADPSARKDTELLARAVTRAKQGDMDAIRFLYARYADSVCTYVQGIVQDSYEAEDITQNLFADLIRKIRRYEQREVPFSAWIMRVARNSALDNLRSRRSIPFEVVRTSDKCDSDANRERCDSIRAALEELPAEQREVLVLRHIAGMSPGEIAQKLSKSEGSIHGLHHRGRGALKATLRELGSAPVIAG
jgi:RNA polymerase sigma-70 factor (ECF subfamily)